MFKIQNTVPGLDTFFQIGGKAPVTMSSSVVNNSENKPIHASPPLPSILRQGVCCLLEVSSNSNTILHSGGGGKESFIFPF